MPVIEEVKKSGVAGVQELQELEEEGPKTIPRHWHFVTRFATSYNEDAYATFAGTPL